METDLLQLRVHQLEGHRTVLAAQRGGDLGVEAGEQLIPHVDHGVRRRGDDQVDGFAGNLG
jgi:hypothetical protein